jgi:uncharacterized protein
MDKNRRLAVIGSGISGAATAWLMRRDADVTLFEANQRFGGHTHTVDVKDSSGQDIRIDTGFMVFNRPNYPLLSALFDELGIATYPTDMSFAASIDTGRVEYAGSSLNTLFGQRRNLVRPRFWRMLREILRFNRAAHAVAAREIDIDMPLERFLDDIGVDAGMRQTYLYPMAAAIWSCPTDAMARFPAASFLRFFQNHGLININDRPQWLTVEGGSGRYMARLIDDLGERACCGTPVVGVERLTDGVAVTLAGGRREIFDAVVLACHSDQALRLLAQPTAAERELVGAVAYQPNRVLLHTDPALMPRRRRVWSSWNYIGATRQDGSSAVSVTYWMNSLQRLDTRSDYFVSLNPLSEPRADRVVAEFEYQHPVFDAAALRAQRELGRIQGEGGVWYAGAWTGYGFHEDGMRSAVEVATALGARLPWTSEAAASRALTLRCDPIGEAA